VEKNSQIHIILVDDHQVVRDGIKSLLSACQEAEVIAEADSGAALFDLLRQHQPDIILLDIGLPDISGIEITRRLREEYPKIGVLILSMYNSEAYIFNALKAGAMGYLPKTTTRAELTEAVRQVHKGQEYFAPSISNIILKSFVRQSRNDSDSDQQKLTQRETEILRLFAEGKTNPEIADALFISVRTVESHKNHIMQKLELKTTVDLIKFAIRSKIIEI